MTTEQSRSRDGFTLIELLVVIAIIALLSSLLIGSIVKAREGARASFCAANLKSAGVGMFQFSSRDPGGKLCTGNFDYQREGCLDRWGWVADLLNHGHMERESYICPSNPLKVNEKVVELYGVKTNDNLNDLTGAYRARYNDGICGETEWKGISGTGSSGGFANTDELTEERRALVSRYFVGQGYNTNYAASWFLIHTAPRVQYRASDQTIRTNGQAAQQGLKGRRETLGPLNERYLSRSDVPHSRIALLGDAAPGDIDEAITPVDFAYDRDDYFAGTDTGRASFVTSGSLLTETLCEGPTFYHRSQRELKRIGSNGSRLEVQWKCDFDESCEPPTGSSGNHMYMQSTLAWIGTHSGSGGFAVNLLFADGSVRTFSDINGDLFLNPGYPIPEGLTQAQYDQIGYRDNIVELPRSQFFNGVFIAPGTLKGVFE